MKEQVQALEHATVRQHCKALRVPVIGANFAWVSKQAVKEKHSHIDIWKRCWRWNRKSGTGMPSNIAFKMRNCPGLRRWRSLILRRPRRSRPPKIRELAEGGYIQRAEPIVLIGEGTGKTHLASGLCVAACRQKKRVRFTTAANLVNEFVEAKQHNALKRVVTRWLRYDVITLDEVGYVPLAEIGAEFLFQVISERAERAAVIVTTNLPFSEWTQVFPNSRLCKALLDRITDRAHIIETGSESYRFRRTIEGRQKKKAS
jgi:hypothetical protein